MGNCMSKAYKVVAKTIPTGDRKGETVYTVSPVSYGLLTTDEVAKQISTECTATPADVKAVLDRYAYYVKENLKKGYDVELLGFGTMTIRFIISHSVDDVKMATGKIVNCLMPYFRPSYTMHNGTRIYNLIPDKVSLVKYGENVSTDEGETTPPADDSGTTTTDPTEDENGNGEKEPAVGGEEGSGGSTEEGDSAYQLNPPTDDLAEAAAAGVSVGDYSNHHEIYNVYLSKDNEYESELEASRAVCHQGH